MDSQPDRSSTDRLDAWDDEGGALVAPPSATFIQLTGTPSQVEWAERIRGQVDAEFDRVAAAFRAVADKQTVAASAETHAVIAILEDQRAEVMRREQAGYFIHDWHELDDQVRKMIAQDPKFQELKARAKRKVSL